MITALGHAAPDVKWLALIGGSGSDRANAVAVDSAGNAYITGSISGTNVMFGDHLASNSGDRMCVAKFDRKGSNVWVSTVGGTQTEGRGIAVDEDGNVYASGSVWAGGATTNSFGNTNLTGIGGSAFLAKLNDQGEFQWVRRVSSSAGVSSLQLATSLTIMGTNLYLAGQCHNYADFGTTVLTNAAMFLAVYDLDGNLTAAHRLAEPVVPGGIPWQVA
ncbi:MAG TPA: SBBP repeat-containing protein, partial [Methylomirabilota bacterium]|nr:SBBP repeat-containing protein [Methylomirabilota bacterium]